MNDVDGNYMLTPFYFYEFDYTPDINIKLLEPLHPIDTYSIPSEGPASFQVKYCDAYGNSPSTGYPQLTLIFPDNSTHTYTMQNPDGSDVYKLPLTLDKGAYKYTYSATNDNYTKGIYEISGNWYVTTRPYNFVKITPIDLVEVVPYGVNFSWKVSTDETDDSLTYDFYIGNNSSKTELVRYSTSPAVNATTFIIPELNHKKQYYWYMRITNKYGADIETDLFTFYTGGMVDKFYNAPNPFNPAKGQKTKFVFAMPQDGTAKIILYSEYGDKVWESETVSASGGTSKEVTYDGRDNSGKMLYNGTYLAVLTKKYSGTTKVERCRILIIK